MSLFSLSGSQCLWCVVRPDSTELVLCVSVQTKYHVQNVTKLIKTVSYLAKGCQPVEKWLKATFNCLGLERDPTITGGILLVACIAGSFVWRARNCDSFSSLHSPPPPPPKPAATQEGAQARFVQTTDSAVHQIILYPADKY